MRDYLIAGVLGVIMILNALDVVTDIGLGVPRWHIVEESMIVLASGIGFIYLLWEMRRRSREMQALTHSLNSAGQQLQDITEEMRRARSNFSESIQQQFQDWGLTLSEQQVAMLLLKGLSFREIAVVRDTREKTVRQQASSIYGKSGLDGRHAFSAWFLEDFLSADPVHESAPGSA
ncbi:LuxR family transcriptional regulator [Pseudohalioglobus sediminis]|uniref:LuxR family transcriptional regulator n=1 Tax=Pseudohalioglobus sediminis TaxID=2606449 RepID=A0A5B0X368_9GAMM|nr:LuxR family transcriptional regulator [Pseudohalioglobus sediminis]KAA1193068.1 LuxR family transcriptional regulator [Pseudohalioglobus sediminis]